MFYLIHIMWRTVLTSKVKKSKCISMSLCMLVLHYYLLAFFHIHPLHKLIESFMRDALLLESLQAELQSFFGLSVDSYFKSHAPFSIHLFWLALQGTALASQIYLCIDCLVMKFSSVWDLSGITWLVFIILIPQIKC